MFAQIVSLALLISVSLSGASSVPETQCSYQLVESMPVQMSYKQDLTFELAKTHEVLLNLINGATSKIQLVSFYSTLTPENQEHIGTPTAEPGRLLLEALESASRDRHIKVEMILGNVPNVKSNKADLDRYRAAGIEVKFLDPTKLFGGGIQHAKYLIADEESFYLGSANLDWRAMTHVKEMGISYTHCKELTADLVKIFNIYSLMSNRSELPASVPTELATRFTNLTPLTLQMDQVPTNVFLSASPREFNSLGDERVDDIEAIVDMINKAKKFVYVSVMRFRSYTGRYGTYWPVIENALRAAVLERRVTVKLLVSKWGKVYDTETAFYKSLQAYSFPNNPKQGGIEIKYFKVPSDDPFLASVPFARVKHDKYVVTESGVYFGTSNWEQDYFRRTSGVGITIRPSELRAGGIVDRMVKIFERDYNSEHVEEV